MRRDEQKGIAPSQQGEGASRKRRIWWVARWVIGVALAALALWALLGRRGELSGAGTYLAHLDPLWLVPAVLVEAGSLLSFSAVSRWLLRAGRVDLPMRWATAITLVSTTISNSLPGGPVVATVFSYRQYRRHGADEALSAWGLVAVFVAASVSLAALSAAGAAIAGAEGANLDLVGPILVVLVLTVAMGVVFVHRRGLMWSMWLALRTCKRVLGRPRGELADHVETFMRRLTTVNLTPAEALGAAGFALANWVLDCSCLALAFPALGAGVPWKGLLLAYGAGQLAANLPITPGGLGVVEGSLTIALVAYGGVRVSTVAAVLLYRILSFWIELPLGWATWGWMAWRDRRNDLAGEVNEAEVATASEAVS